MTYINRTNSFFKEAYGLIPYVACSPITKTREIWQELEPPSDNALDIFLRLPRKALQLFTIALIAPFLIPATIVCSALALVLAVEIPLFHVLSLLGAFIADCGALIANCNTDTNVQAPM